MTASHHRIISFLHMLDIAYLYHIHSIMLLRVHLIVSYVLRLLQLCIVSFLEVSPFVHRLPGLKTIGTTITVIIVYMRHRLLDLRNFSHWFCLVFWIVLPFKEAFVNCIHACFYFLLLRLQSLYFIIIVIISNFYQKRHQIPGSDRHHHLRATIIIIFL